MFSEHNSFLGFVMGVLSYLLKSYLSDCGFLKKNTCFIMFWKVGPGRVDGRGLGYVQLGLQDSFLTTFSEQIICKKKIPHEQALP